jgi:hypothetical protein
MEWAGDAFAMETRTLSDGPFLEKLERLSKRHGMHTEICIP